MKRLRTIQSSKVWHTKNHIPYVISSSTRTHTHPPNHPPTHTLYCSLQPDSLIAGPIHITHTLHTFLRDIHLGLPPSSPSSVSGTSVLGPTDSGTCVSGSSVSAPSVSRTSVSVASVSAILRTILSSKVWHTKNLILYVISSSTRTHTHPPSHPPTQTLYCTFQPDSLIAAPIHTTQTYLHSKTKSSLASTNFKNKSNNNIPSASATSTRSSSVSAIFRLGNIRLRAIRLGDIRLRVIRLGAIRLGDIRLRALSCNSTQVNTL